MRVHMGQFQQKSTISGITLKFNDRNPKWKVILILDEIHKKSG